MNQPLVSIIIPTYNRAHIIGETLDSVLTQTYTNWECIVVDDGSTDATDCVFKDYCERESRIKFYKRPKHKTKGANACRNYGVSLSSGEYLMFLDSDDKMLDFCVSNRIKCVIENMDNHFWVFSMLVSNGENNLIEKKIDAKQQLIDAFLKYKLPWGIMCVLWNTSFFKKHLSFDETLPRLNDPDLHIKALLIAEDKYTVCTKAKPDTIYYPSSENRSPDFAIRYYNSLIVFFPKVISLLDEYGNPKKKVFLKNYLIDFLKWYQKAIGIKKTRKILAFANRLKIIKTKDYFSLFFVYVLRHINNKIDKFLADRIRRKLERL